jgi:hypothetical protein
MIGFPEALRRLDAGLSIPRVTARSLTARRWARRDPEHRSRTPPPHVRALLTDRGRAELERLDRASSRIELALLGFPP